jgi:adenylate cyclase class IV
LTSKDWWLRNRNGVFELKKVVVGENKDTAVDRYDEVDDEKEIAKDLEINFENTLAESLKQNQIEPFATIVATRKKYQKGDFNLDLDLTDFGYSICEIELMVEDETKMAEAMAKIENFRVEYGLNAGPVRGKLVEYIYRNRPEHYAILLKSGVIR